MLRTHDFIEFVPGNAVQPLRFFACKSCDRRFKFDPDVRVTWAIANDEKSSVLKDAAAARWLSERCAGRPEDADERDSKKLKRATR